MRSAVIVANGSSQRYGSDKLQQMLHGKFVLQHSIDAFVPYCDNIIVVCDVDKWQHLLSNATLVNGGQTRSQSVLCGLSALTDCQYVAIHDGARPYVSGELIERLFDTAMQYGSAVPTCKVTDTIYMAEGQQLLDREALVTVQTPQVFELSRLMQSLGDSSGGTDEAQRYIACHGSVHFVEGQYSNVKLTYNGQLPTYRVGNGYDVHAMTQGSGIVLGGVNIPCDYRLIAHSDGDVLVHAIMDSLLSSIGEGDIGQHFPDNDASYLGIDSMLLLDRVLSMVASHGFSIVNVSAVVIAEKPKLMPYIDRIRDNIALRLHIATSCVGITATTTERLGVVGQGQAIAVEAQCLILSNN